MWYLSASENNTEHCCGVALQLLSRALPVLKQHADTHPPNAGRHRQLCCCSPCSRTQTVSCLEATKLLEAFSSSEQVLLQCRTTCIWPWQKSLDSGHCTLFSSVVLINQDADGVSGLILYRLHSGFSVPRMATRKQ